MLTWIWADPFSAIRISAFSVVCFLKNEEKENQYLFLICIFFNSAKWALPHWEWSLIVLLIFAVVLLLCLKKTTNKHPTQTNPKTKTPQNYVCWKQQSVHVHGNSDTVVNLTVLHVSCLSLMNQMRKHDEYRHLVFTKLWSDFNNCKYLTTSPSKMCSKTESSKEEREKRILNTSLVAEAWNKHYAKHSSNVL